MAHKKAGGSKARQGGNVAGKRRGIKVGVGKLVKSGAIIMRQLGTVIKPGKNVGLGRDFTLFVFLYGRVRYSNLRKDKKLVSVVSS